MKINVIPYHSISKEDFINGIDIILEYAINYK